MGEFLSQRWERNQRIAGGDSHRRRKQVPSGSSSFSPSPPFTGDTPIPFRKISGAQNMVPGMISPGPLGPGAVQNFGWYGFTSAPGSDQPWQRVRDRGCAGRGRSKNRREGQAPPLRDGRGNVPRRGTGGSPDTPAGAPPQRFRSRAIRRARLVQCGGESAGESYSPPDQTASARRAKVRVITRTPHAGPGVQKEGAPPQPLAAAGAWGRGLGQNDQLRALRRLVVFSLGEFPAVLLQINNIICVADPIRGTVIERLHKMSLQFPREIRGKLIQVRVSRSWRIESRTDVLF